MGTKYNTTTTYEIDEPNDYNISKIHIHAPKDGEAFVILEFNHGTSSSSLGWANRFVFEYKLSKGSL